MKRENDMNDARRTNSTGARHSLAVLLPISAIAALGSIATAQSSAPVPAPRSATVAAGAASVDSSAPGTSSTTVPGGPGANPNSPTPRASATTSSPTTTSTSTLASSNQPAHAPAGSSTNGALPVSFALASSFEQPPAPPDPVVRTSSSLLAVALNRSARYDKQPVAPGSMEAMSLFAVRSPEQRKFTRHDLVQIIVRETSRARADQTLDTKKDYTVAAEVAWANFSFDAFGQPGVATSSGAHDAPVFEAIGRKRLKGEGEYDRTDEFTTRMTAEVVEVLPNGNLILEARTTISNDKEMSCIKLTGICRPDDITSANTVLSNQIHDLKIEKLNTGFVKDAADKGIIAQVLDAILAF